MQITPDEERIITLYRQADQRDKAVVQNVLGRYKCKDGIIVEFPKPGHQKAFEKA